MQDGQRVLQMLQRVGRENNVGFGERLGDISDLKAALRVLFRGFLNCRIGKINAGYAAGRKAVCQKCRTVAECTAIVDKMKRVSFQISAQRF